MDFSALRLLTADLKTATLLCMENNTAAAKLDFKSAGLPLLLEKAQNKIFFLASSAEQSTLYTADASAVAFTKQPLSLPPVSQAALSSDGLHLYMVDNANTLTYLNTSTGELTKLAQPDKAACVGLCTDSAGNVHTAWETAQGLAAASFNATHQLCREYYLTAIPTNIACQADRIYVTFTQSPVYGEGIAVFQAGTADKICSFCPPQTQPAFQLYPCNICFAPTDSRIYVINEDAAAITCLNSRLEPEDCFMLGHSISTLQFTADPRFAVAASNMFADLLLLDMVNKKILSLSDNDAEFSVLFCLL